MLSQKQIDIDYGKASENELFDKLKNKFDSNLVRSTNKYDRFDYYSDRCIVELKTRRVYKNTYWTTMVGLNKAQECLRDNGKDYYFVFKFYDGTFYWKFNKTEYDMFEKRVGGRTDRGYDEFSLYLYIPINRLVKV